MASSYDAASVLLQEPLQSVETFLTTRWLHGAVVALLGAALNVVGIYAQKAAMHQVVFAEATPLESVKEARTHKLPPPEWKSLFRNPLYWFGLCLLLSHVPVIQFSLYYVPEIPVAALSGAQLLLNFMMAYGLLNERFTRTDLRATCVCAVAMVASVSAIPESMVEHVADFPTRDLVQVWEEFWSNRGFAVYLLVWLLLLSICVVVGLTKQLRDDFNAVAKQFTVPLLVSLFTSQWHFLSRPTGRLLFGRGGSEAWEEDAGYYVIAAMMTMVILSMFAMCEGLRHFDCRFFVPTTVACSTVMVVVQRVSFFREWHAMSVFTLVCFGVSCSVSVVACHLVCADGYKILLQGLGVPRRIINGLRSLATPHDEGGDVIGQHHGVLAILEEHSVRGSPPAGIGRGAEIIDLEYPTTYWSTLLRSAWRLVPLFWCIVAPLIVAILYSGSWFFTTLFFLTLVMINNGWKYGLHIALFSYVAQTKMALFSQADFQALHEAEMAQTPNSQRIVPPTLRWEDIVHCVLVVNYKEDLSILRATMETIAASKIAVEQICLVLAMEQREPNVQEKANVLVAEFADAFRHVIVTYHPENLEGEVPGKSANTKWAADRLFQEELAARGLELSNVVITVADADSEFDPEYFAALTYYYLYAGVCSDGTPERFVTIWQPPILHYKNYLQQPPIVRLASLFTCQKELACLADPHATRIPYSTYSISATLAKAVGGWDPDWISEDWHMGLKCFLCTGGRFRVSPIFYAVVNTTPEGEGLFDTLWSRWTQAKRHALGFSELTFFHEHFPRVICRVPGAWNRFVFCFKAVFYYAEMVSTHATMATLVIVGPANGWVIMAIFQNRQDIDTQTWTCLVNAFFQGVSSITFLLFIFTNALLFESVRLRLIGGTDPELCCIWRYRFAHFLYLVISCSPMVPFFFFLGCIAEWIAAFKAARTNKFLYEVASKPVVGKEMHGSQVFPEPRRQGSWMSQLADTLKVRAWFGGYEQIPVDELGDTSSVG
eukprot:TRINITY_DN23727_c0_g1_i1.p1 TRINITY_DN23727_c0_g1~~TRINITY_DN23727_c0_g1_i1.p1  ORF type:complete len:1014 (-),score=173.00 TRINITY_DN23727_c0_g1_i1:51-3053(-)